MIILSDCLTETADEGSLKVASSLAGRLKARYPDTTVISYGRRSPISDVHLKLNKLLLGPGLGSILRRKREPVLYIPFPAPVLPTALRIWILSRFARYGLRVLLAMQADTGPLAKLLLRGSGAEVVTLSRTACEYYRTLVGGRAMYLRTGVDTEHFSPADAAEKTRLREKYGVRPGKRVVLHVGHLKEERNIRQLLKVSAEYHVFLVVSTLTEREEPLRRELEARPDTTIIDTYVPDIREIYRMADVYFFPVRQACSCIDVPLSALEAAACNVPVVTTAYGELRELAGKPGFWFVDSFEPDSLNRLLNRAAADGADVRSGVLDYDWNYAVDVLGKRRRVLHLLVSGNVGGIEILMKNYAACSAHENCFLFLWSGGEMEEKMRSGGARTVVMDLRRDGCLKTLRRIERLWKEKRFDTVVSHNSAPFLKVVLLWLKLRHRNVRALAYAHSNARDICRSSRKRGLRLRWLIHKAAFCLCDGVIAISESVKRSLTAYLHIPPERIRVIRNGIPIPEENPRRTAGRPPELLYVGRLTQEKGVQVTLKALSLLAGQEEFSFAIVGDGEYRPFLETLARELGLGERVRFLGLRGDVTQLLSQADIFVHAPVWEEGFGLSVVEAMAAGCVCVCTRSGAMEELITDGVDGFLAERHSPEALAAVLKQVLHGGAHEAVRRNARTRAGDFDIKRFSKELDDRIGGAAL